MGLFSTQGWKKKPNTSNAPKPAYGGAYVGGIPNQGSFTTTRQANLPVYKQYIAENRDLYDADPVGTTQGIINYVNSGGAKQGPGGPAPAGNKPPGGGSSSGGGGRRGGGGGGGGGGPTAAQLAQGQMDWMQQLLGSDVYKVNPATYDALRSNVAGATTKDQEAAKVSYDALDRYLAEHQRNPYADVKITRATGGGADEGYGAFQNVLALLGANNQESNASRAAESQMARTYTGNQIGAVDNAYLYSIANQQAQAQQALDAEKRQQLASLAALIGQGAKAPAMSAFGYGGAPAAPAAAPGQADFFNWFNSYSPEQQAQFRAAFPG